MCPCMHCSTARAWTRWATCTTPCRSTPMSRRYSKTGCRSSTTCSTCVTCSRRRISGCPVSTRRSKTSAGIACTRSRPRVTSIWWDRTRPTGATRATGFRQPLAGSPAMPCRPNSIRRCTWEPSRMARKCCRWPAPGHSWPRPHTIRDPTAAASCPRRWHPTLTPPASKSRATACSCSRRRITQAGARA